MGAGVPYARGIEGLNRPALHLRGQLTDVDPIDIRIGGVDGAIARTESRAIAIDRPITLAVIGILECPSVRATRGVPPPPVSEDAVTAAGVLIVAGCAAPGLAAGAGDDPGSACALAAAVAVAGFVRQLQRRIDAW